MIILTIQGLGKTEVAKGNPYIADIDVKYYDDLNSYTNALAEAENSDKYKYVLGNASLDVAKKLIEDFGLSVAICAPWKDRLNIEEYTEMKERMFGRYVLRKEQTPSNLGWLNRMKSNFDKYCSTEMYKDIRCSGLTFIDVTSKSPYMSSIIRNMEN